MTYRPPSRPPKGRWARFLHSQRQARNWSQAQAFEQLREGLNLGPRSRASYIALDMGDRNPRAEEAAFLSQYFDAEPPTEDVPPVAVPSEMAELVQALREQTEAINGLIGRLDGLASGAIRDGVADALREAVRLQGAGGSQGAPPLERSA